MQMTDLQDAVKTITTLSPPMLIIVGAGIMNLMLKPFLPEKFLMPIATIGGGALAPYLFSHGTLAYDVPSPTTALVLIGFIMGFIGSVLHRRLDRWIRNKLMASGSGDTMTFTRNGVDREAQRQQDAAGTRDKMGG